MPGGGGEGRRWMGVGRRGLTAPHCMNTSYESQRRRRTHDELTAVATCLHVTIPPAPAPAPAPRAALKTTP